MYSGHPFMYLNPCRVAPSPQFGLLVTGTGKRLLYGCRLYINLVTGTDFTPKWFYSRTRPLSVLDYKRGLGLFTSASPWFQREPSFRDTKPPSGGTKPKHSGLQ
jgi:hypothetical protein